LWLSDRQNLSHPFPKFPVKLALLAPLSTVTESIDMELANR